MALLNKPALGPETDGFREVYGKDMQQGKEAAPLATSNPTGALSYSGQQSPMQTVTPVRHNPTAGGEDWNTMARKAMEDAHSMFGWGRQGKSQRAAMAQMAGAAMQGAAGAYGSRVGARSQAGESRSNNFTAGQKLNVDAMNDFERNSGQRDSLQRLGIPGMEADTVYKGRMAGVSEREAGTNAYQARTGRIGVNQQGRAQQAAISSDPLRGLMPQGYYSNPNIVTPNNIGNIAPLLGQPGSEDLDRRARGALDPYMGRY